MKKASFLILIFSVIVYSCSQATSEREEIVEDVATAEVEENAFVKADTITIHSMQFQPQNVLVNKGQKLVWINKGIVGHNVTEDPDRSWTSGDFEVGESWEMVVDESFDYLCTLHPTMTGSVKIID